MGENELSKLKMKRENNIKYRIEIYNITKEERD